MELLVTLGTVGILAATAVPQISSYRKRGYEAAVKSDLMNAVTAQEAYFTRTLTYKAGALIAARRRAFTRALM